MLRTRNMQAFLLQFAIWFARERYQSNKTKTTLTVAVKLGYFSKIKERLKSMFPNHDAWKSEDSWYKNLREKFETEAKRFEMLDPESIPPVKLRPIYYDIGNEHKQSQFYTARERNTNNIFAVDLKTYCQRLMAESVHVGGVNGRVTKDVLRERLLLIMTFGAVGRGGELKFLRFDEWTWDCYFQTPDIAWHEIKTLCDHLMMYVPDATSYHCDFFHAFGCYASVEQGLLRSHCSPSCKHHVFPNLHKLGEDAAARAITNILRRYCHPA
jgi:hypothetical protein